MIQDLHASTYIVIFVFAGIAWAGLASLALAVYIGVQRIATPKPPVRRWTKDWDSMDREED